MNRLLRCGATCLFVSLAALLCLSLGCAEPPAKEVEDKEALDPALSVIARYPIGEGADTVAVSPSGALLAYGNAGSGIEVINVPMGVKVHTFPPQAGEWARYYPFAFSGDCSLFVIADRRRITAYNVANWAPGAAAAFRTPDGSNGPGLAAFPQSRDFLLSDGEALFRWTPGAKPARLLKPGIAAGSFEFFPDGARVAGLRFRGSTHWQVRTDDLRENGESTLLEEGLWDWCGTCRQGRPGLPWPLSCPKVSPGGTHLAAAAGSCAFIWDLPNEGKRHEVVVAEGVSGVAFLQGGSYLATFSSYSPRLSIIGVLDGRLNATSTVSSKIQAIAPFQSEPKLAVMTEKELLILAIDLAALDKKPKP